MARQRSIRGVLTNFLGTYLSRHVDFDGYWVFGLIVNELDGLRIDLTMAETPEPHAPRGFVIREAVFRFDEQRVKAGLSRSQLREAWLTIECLPPDVIRPVNGRPTAGHHYYFTAVAVMAGGRRFEQEQVLFIAPHNPKIELRSTRGGA